jgi:hypothetical protein
MHKKTLRKPAKRAVRQEAIRAKKSGAKANDLPEIGLKPSQQEIHELSAKLASTIEQFFGSAGMHMLETRYCIGIAFNAIRMICEIRKIDPAEFCASFIAQISDQETASRFLTEAFARKAEIVAESLNIRGYRSFEDAVEAAKVDGFTGEFMTVDEFEKFIERDRAAN